MIRHDASRIDSKRRSYLDHRRKQFTNPTYKQHDYPHRLNFYSIPPTAEITLEQFEQWAIDRLRGTSLLPPSPTPNPLTSTVLKSSPSSNPAPSATRPPPRQPRTSSPSWRNTCRCRPTAPPRPLCAPSARRTTTRTSSCGWPSPAPTTCVAASHASRRRCFAFASRMTTRASVRRLLRA